VPSNVRAEPFVAQSLVLPRALLVVSHAGIGTMLGAIYHGVPMVLIGTGGDHPVNTRRATEIGIAAALDAREAEAPLLLSTAKRALDDQQFRATAQAFRDECDAMDPISEAVERSNTWPTGPGSTHRPRTRPGCSVTTPPRPLPTGS
jgi:UDP:flavonoid glycosyltransferase YjiC (YdhE family)